MRAPLWATLAGLFVLLGAELALASIYHSCEVELTQLDCAAVPPTEPLSSGLAVRVRYNTCMIQYGQSPDHDECTTEPYPDDLALVLEKENASGAFDAVTATIEQTKQLCGDNEHVFTIRAQLDPSSSYRIRDSKAHYCHLSFRTCDVAAGTSGTDAGYVDSGAASTQHGSCDVEVVAGLGGAGGCSLTREPSRPTFPAALALIVVGVLLCRRRGYPRRPGGSPATRENAPSAALANGASS